MLNILGSSSIAIGAVLTLISWVCTPDLASVKDDEVASLYGGDLCFSKVVVHCGYDSEQKYCNWYVGWAVWAPVEGPGWKFQPDFRPCSHYGSWECGQIPRCLEKCYGSDGMDRTR